MGRRVRTDIPQSTKLLTPNWLHLLEFKEKDQEYKSQQKRNIDRHHKAHPLPLLPNNTPVWVNSQGHQSPAGRIIGPATTPRSYVIEVHSGQVRRNRTNLNKRAETSAHQIPTSANERPVTRSQTGAPLHPPDCLSYWRKEMWHNSNPMRVRSHLVIVAEIDNVMLPFIELYLFCMLLL